ncbi:MULTISPECIES: DinB family protein [unclassified Streptomyces]|uniref:DinB family protein n=1 Tax=unclassified Streptomyces TaxID=2593676 RepID=UPI003330371A
MTTPRTDLLLRQLDIAWALFEYHADGLDDALCLWTPDPYHWTVRPNEQGRWVADFQVPEPDPVPALTIGWVTWHIGYWWTATLRHCFRDPAPSEHDEVFWPGTAQGAVEWLRGLHERWRARLDGLTDAELDSTERTATLPWGAGMSLADVAGWVNVELTKNVAEIGLLRILHGARNARP